MAGSIIWCDRTPFNVLDSTDEVENRLESCKQQGYTFAWFDRQLNYETDKTPQVALRVDKVSCIEPNLR